MEAEIGGQTSWNLRSIGRGRDVVPASSAASMPCRHFADVKTQDCRAFLSSSVRARSTKVQRRGRKEGRKEGRKGRFDLCSSRCAGLQTEPVDDIQTILSL